ncbi:MAG: hypothetical protein OSB41_00585 [Kiritimatiellae bacterium]|nr:hypothetical protein [Kiritimatiellia bacterium]
MAPDGRRVDVGYWKPCSTSEHGQSYVYNTTLCALTLQVYFRSLPTYMDSAIQAELTQSNTFNKDPVEITIDPF